MGNLPRYPPTCLQSCKVCNFVQNDSPTSKEVQRREGEERGYIRGRTSRRLCCLWRAKCGERAGLSRSKFSLYVLINVQSSQIVLYVVSRVMASFIPRSSSPYNTSSQSALATSVVKTIPPHSKYFTVFAALSWGAVMWLFRHRGETIQPGMFNSMQYLYRDSETWNDLRTLFWHNT